MKDKLFTKNYLCLMFGHFMLNFGFWLQMPIMPYYLEQEFTTNKATIGFVISCYTISALCMRAFSGFLLDTFSRKPLFLIAFTVFASVFSGYYFAASLTVFCIFRAIHGLSFGLGAVSSNTIVIDIMPSSRRGEGIGYYGLANNLAMALGPLTGLYFSGTSLSYRGVFVCGFVCAMLGIIISSFVKTKPKPKIQNRQPLSFDRFLLLKGIPAGIALLLLSIPYGITTNYVVKYAEESGLQCNSQIFFILMAVGMAFSRVFSGRLVDKGYVTQAIFSGMILVIGCYLMLGSCNAANNINPIFGTTLFVTSAILKGIGFGILFPAYNYLFVALAPNNRRGTATSTYLTSWDVGLGIGICLGGIIAQKTGSYAPAYICGAFTCLVSAIYFKLRVSPHFVKNRLDNK
ncbi:MAG: MFS transporter [Bacteroidales bacterium]|nr:MFS transporter [Bacteroidales bacterium]